MTGGSLIGGVLDGRPLPQIDGDNRAFYEASARGELLIQRCVETGRFQFYPRVASMRTGGAVEWVKASGRGVVYSCSVVRANFLTPAFQPALPYVVAIIALDEGVRMMGNVIDCEPSLVRIGARVSVDFRCVDPATDLHLPFWRLLQDEDRA